MCWVARIEGDGQLRSSSFSGFVRSDIVSFRVES